MNQGQDCLWAEMNTNGPTPRLQSEQWIENTVLYDMRRMPRSGINWPRRRLKIQHSSRNIRLHRGSRSTRLINSNDFHPIPPSPTRDSGCPSVRLCIVLLHRQYAVLVDDSGFIRFYGLSSIASMEGLVREYPLNPRMNLLYTVWRYKIGRAHV